VVGQCWRDGVLHQLAGIGAGLELRLVRVHEPHPEADEVVGAAPLGLAGVPAGADGQAPGNELEGLERRQVAGHLVRRQPQRAADGGRGLRAPGELGQDGEVHRRLTQLGLQHGGHLVEQRPVRVRHVGGDGTQWVATGEEVQVAGHPAGDRVPGDLLHR
jgi:hypothetical protein